MSLPTEGTLLVLDGIGIPLYSARGLTQTIKPIDQAAQTRRTLNGILKDLSYSQFRKLTTTLSCKDQRPPSLNNVWPGTTVTMHCVQRLTYPVGGTPMRPAVIGSTIQEGDFVSYLPILQVMLVKPWELSTDEWPADVTWQSEWEEVGE
jgi:hypothetical protein